METTTVSFPGLGIGEFTMNKIALSFQLFGKPIEIRWYGILITLGIVLAILYASWRAKQENISTDDLLDMGIFAIIFGVMGARAYYVLTYGIENFVIKGADGKLKFWDTFVSIIGVWNGGIAIYGAIIAGALTIYFVCRHKKIKFLKAFDAVILGVMIGQILGRWGNFVNGEAYGGIVGSNSPLYWLRMGLQSRYGKMSYVHPTFLYESVWNLIGFIIIHSLYKKKKFDGQVFLMYITWYGFGRMLIEGLRTDSLMIGVFRISQVVGFLCFVIRSALLVRGFILAKRVACENANYAPVYKRFIKKASINEKTVDTDSSDGVLSEDLHKADESSETKNTTSLEEDFENGKNN